MFQAATCTCRRHGAKTARRVIHSLDETVPNKRFQIPRREKVLAAACVVDSLFSLPFPPPPFFFLFFFLFCGDGCPGGDVHLTTSKRMLCQRPRLPGNPTHYRKTTKANQGMFTCVSVRKRRVTRLDTASLFSMWERCVIVQAGRLQVSRFVSAR